MKWLRTLASLGLLLLCAFTPTQNAVLFGNSPSWIFAGAAVDIDLVNMRSWGCGGSIPNCLQITRASNATNLLPSSPSGFSYTTYGNNTLRIDTKGLLVEEARTNVFLNSTTPATQTINFGSTGNNTLWVNGSGSIVMSAGTATGCGTGTATNGTSVTFNITVIGTCVFTKTGSLNAAQVEAGTFGTSLIVTGGTSAARASDNISLANGLLTSVLGIAGSVVISGGPDSNSGNGWFMPASVANYIAPASNTTIRILSGGNSATATLGGGKTFSGSVFKVAASWDTGMKQVVGDNGTAGTNANSFTFSAPVYFGGLNGTGNSDTYFTRLTVWNYRIPDTSLKNFTQ